ncbi:MAG: thiolase domain-containing protein [Candidatus Aenigmatarchaeota archaeon]
MKNVAIVGIGQVKFGENWNESLRDIATGAIRSAMLEADIGTEDVEALYIGNMGAGRFIGQEHLSALIADHSRLLHKPATRCEAACASGALAFRQAYLSVMSGRHDVVMVVGAEKMTDLKTGDATSALITAGDQETEASSGITFAGLYALIARAHMNAYGTTSEQLAMVSVINHRNAIGNKYAQFQYEISVADVLKSAMVAEPLHLLDCSPITDGAAALIIASENAAKRFKSPVWILASEQASDTIALHDRKSLTEMLATKHAAKTAYEKLRITPSDIDFAEVHDCFSINEILAIEDLGFCEKGRGGELVESGEIKLKGSIPINTTGGLKAIGHPVGATGVRQLVDITRQLRGECYNQVKGDLGLALNVGGSGATALLTILGKEVR